MTYCLIQPPSGKNDRVTGAAGLVDYRIMVGIRSVLVALRKVETDVPNGR